MGVPIGLSKPLVKLSVVAEFPEVLSIDVNIGGLPLTKSSCAQLWPILVRDININKCPVFPVGFFSSKNKPSNCVQYMSKFTSELSDLTINGITISNKKVNLEHRAVACDAPARAFVTGTPGHTSSPGCTKCLQVGRKVDGTLTYSTVAVS